MSIYEDLEVFTGQEELNAWSAKPFVIGSLTSPSEVGGNTNGACNFCHASEVFRDGRTCANVDYANAVTITQYANDNKRKIGYIQDVMDDGSYIISILGNGELPINALTNKYVTTYLQGKIIFNTDILSQELKVEKELGGIYWTDSQPNPGRGNANISARTGLAYDMGYLNELQGFDYTPEWQAWINNAGRVESNDILRRFGKLNGQSISMDYLTSIQLTDNENTTLTIGDMYQEYLYYPHDNMVMRNGIANIGGLLNAIHVNIINAISSLIDGMPISIIREGNTPLTSQYEFVQPAMGTTAGFYCPFNLILTRNLEEAKNYLNTGELPSDAFLYPFDVDNIPVNDTGVDPDPEPVNPDDGDDVPDESGEPDDDVDSTPTELPYATPLSLTNNNLYWLTSVELASFINWFWTDATDIASAGDLWDKIIGLYENLAQAVLNVRYMPIDISWIGGTSPVASIVVGQIEKVTPTSAINKSVAPIRNIGTISFPERFNGGFANYSPYCTASLWLPFHGFIDLDVDLLVGSTLAVQCVYDIQSGTIQYFIFRGGYNGQLINTVTAKMAVDIPITLQTKTERDSAIFGNVSSAVASLVGAGASAVAGSPVGLTMAMANFTGMQPQGAGISVKGTVGETGAFYQPSHCALYVKRPNYNRPDIYGKRVGYPANSSKQLKSCKGYTQVYNPYIDFHHNVKPYKEEIDQIYSYLEKGVIL